MSRGFFASASPKEQRYAAPAIGLSLLVASLLTLVAWSKVLFTPGFIMHGDLTFATTLENTASNYYPLWGQHPSMSNIDEVDRIHIMLPLFWIARHLHIDVGLFSRLFPFIIALTGALGIVVCKRTVETYLITERVTDSWARFATDVLAVAVFTWNPWALYRVEAPYYQLAYATLPILIACQLTFLIRGKVWALFGTAIAWTLASGSPQYTIFVSFTSIAFFLAPNYRALGMARATAVTRYLSTIVLYILINLYWIGAVFDIRKIEPVAPGYTLRWADVMMFSANASWYNVVSGTSFWVTWWTAFNPLAHGFFNILGLVLRPMIFMLAVALIITFRRDRFMRMAALFIAATLVLLKGANGVFGPAYHALIVNLGFPFGWVIREPEKFGAFLWLFYALAIGVGTILWLRRASPRSVLAISALLVSFVVLAFLPIMNGTLFGRYVPVPIPRTYLQLAERFRNTHAKALVLGDYEELSRYNSGDAVFRWAPLNMAGSTVSRSLPMPTFGGYHFTNGFSQVYSFIKEAGPRRLPVYAAILGTKYILLERDVEGDEAWYQQWKAGVLASGAQLVQESADFGLFKYPHVVTGERRSGPYGVFVGDGAALNGLIDKFGVALAARILFSIEQRLAQPSHVLERASMIILADRSVVDAVADCYPPSAYIPLRALSLADDPGAGWANFRLSSQYEENGGGWNDWERRALHLPVTWSQDLDLGVITTALKGATYTVERSLATYPHDVDVWMRVYDFSGPQRPKLRVDLNGSIFFVNGESQQPRWRWLRIGALSGQHLMHLVLQSQGGAPAVNTVLIVPRGDVEHKADALRHSQGSRIVSLASISSLASWPPAAVSGETNVPSGDVDANGALLLNEVFDRLWIAHTANGIVYARPAWLYANGFQPVKGAARLEFVPQASVERWWRIEWPLLAVFVVLAVLFSVRQPSRDKVKHAP